MTELGRSVAIFGREIWARQDGSGPDVLLIGGLGDTHLLWSSTVERLADTHRCTSYDNAGIGRSSAPSGEVSIPSMAADAIGLMDELGVDQAHVVGSSMGGAIAQELALAAPARARSLTLVGTWGCPDAFLAALLRHFCWLVGLDADTAAADAFALWVYGGVSHANGTRETLDRDAAENDWPWQTVDQFKATAEAAIRHDARMRLAEIRLPTLVVVGEEDRICPPRLSRQLAAALPESEFILIPDLGHELYREDPDQFASLLRQFWSRVR